MPSRQISRRPPGEVSKPPWRMPKRHCVRGERWASMQRSIHRSVLYVAISNLRHCGLTDDTTSSRAIITSLPMSFWRFIDSSGVS